MPTSTVHIGEELTRGLGAGANPAGRLPGGRGESRDEIREALAECRHGLRHRRRGRRHGHRRGPRRGRDRHARRSAPSPWASSPSPSPSRAARARNQAEQGIDLLSQKVDTLIVIPNDRLLQVVDKKTSMLDAFRIADDIAAPGHRRASPTSSPSPVSSTSTSRTSAPS